MGSGKEGEEDEITKLNEVHLHTSTHFYYALWGRVRARFKKSLDATKIRMRCNGMGWNGMGSTYALACAGQRGPHAGPRTNFCPCLDEQRACCLAAPHGSNVQGGPTGLHGRISK